MSAWARPLLFLPIRMMNRRKPAALQEQFLPWANLDSNLDKDCTIGLIVHSRLEKKSTPSFSVRACLILKNLLLCRPAFSGWLSSVKECAASIRAVSQPLLSILRTGWSTAIGQPLLALGSLLSGVLLPILQVDNQESTMLHQFAVHSIYRHSLQNYVLTYTLQKAKSEVRKLSILSVCLWKGRRRHSWDARQWSLHEVTWSEEAIGSKPVPTAH